MKSILDPRFKYKSSASHGDSSDFAKRQRARARLIRMQATAARTNTEAVGHPGLSGVTRLQPKAKQS